MDITDIISKCDHTILNPTATWKDIKQVCDDGINFSAASVCIPPSFVKKAKAYVKDKIKICTVIGFPNGYNTTKVKVLEAEDAVLNGADEIDMVINIGALKEKNYDFILNEITAVRNVCPNKILKIIIETCLLSTEEKIQMCRIVTKSGADFIKTSTGFSKSGASFEDIKLFSENIGDNVKIKAAGGISSVEDASLFISLGASRIGTSQIINNIKNR